MVAGDRQTVISSLAQYKNRGVLEYNKVLQIPSSERIPELIRGGTQSRGLIASALTAAIKSAMENINIRVGLTEDQLIEVADLIIDESHEDYLALEDVLLFLQQLVSGKAGTINDRMDIPTFFKFFEVYRESRHVALREARYEQEVNFKSLGPRERSSEDTKSMREEQREAISAHLEHLYKKNK